MFNYFLVVFLCLVSTTSIATGNYESMNVSPKELAELAKQMQVVFPPKTHPLGIRKLIGLDDAVFLKIEFSQDEWLQFLKTSPIQASDLSDAKRFFLGEDQGWWDPSQPTKLPTAQALLPEGKILNLGVDQSKSDLVIVYLMWHST